MAHRQHTTTPTSTTMHAKKSHFLLVRRAAMDLLRSDDECDTTTTLFHSRLLQDPYQYINMIYNDDSVFRDMETVLHFMFSHAAKHPDFVFVLDKLKGCSHQLVEDAAKFYSGRGSQTMSFSTRRKVINSISTANFLVSRHDTDGAVYGKHCGTDVITSSRKMIDSMVRFLQNLGDQERLGTHYDPASDELLYSAWNTLLHFLVEFSKWIHKWKDIGDVVFTNFESSSLDFTMKISTTSADAPPTLVSRIQSCVTLSKAIVTGSSTHHRYPPGSIFHPKNPCDMFLRTLMGEPACNMDFIVLPMHDAIVKQSEGYLQQPLHALTKYVIKKATTKAHAINPGKPCVQIISQPLAGKLTVFCEQGRLRFSCIHCTTLPSVVLPSHQGTTPLDQGHRNS